MEPHTTKIMINYKNAAPAKLSFTTLALRGLFYLSNQFCQQNIDPAGPAEQYSILRIIFCYNKF
jgi:hypothetical protein